MNVKEVTGLALASMIDAQRYYELRSERIEGAPEFCDEVLPWLRYLDNARDGETWESLTRRIEAEHDAAARGGDIFRAIYPDDDSEVGKRFFALEIEKVRIDEVLVKASGLWSVENDDPLVTEVFLRLIALSPMWSRIPDIHDPNSADWIWARMRCVCASAGYNNHAALATELCKLYPQCPFLADEPKDVWTDALVTAHKACGWPAHLGQVPWRDWCGCMGVIEEAETSIVDWHRVVAALHVLKHLRIDDVTGAVAIVYRGAAFHGEWPGQGRNMIPAGAVESILPHLAAPRAASKKLGHPLRSALKWALTNFGTNVFLRRRATTALSGLILHGPWSTLTPDPTALSNFAQHGSKLDGVWLASNGVVAPISGSNADIVGYQWNVDNAQDQRLADARVRLERILPEKYTPGFASDLFWEAFPNIEMPAGMDLDAVKCLFDAPVVASLIRAEVPGLTYEYPFVAFLPQTPTLDESTNQGKTFAALTYARMLSPGIEKITSGLDSGSAPDIRAMADDLRTYGTAALDEFQVPRSKAHILSRESLQLLCTGGQVSSGRVLENSGTLSLKHSLVASAKALDFGPDLTNRTLAFYLSNLTDAHRDNEIVLESIQSGRLALLARLQMLALVVESGLTTALGDTSKVSTAQGLRFGVHRAIARILYRLRTGRADEGQVDATVGEMREHFRGHQHAAEDSGVFASLEEGKTLRIRLSSLFTDLSPDEFKSITEHLAFKGTAIDGALWGTTGQLLAARVVIGGLSSTGVAVGEAIGRIVGLRGRAGHRAVVMAVDREIRATIQPGARLRLAGTNWFLYRRDTEAGMLVRLEERAP